MAKVIPEASGRDRTGLCIPRGSSSDSLLSTSHKSSEDLNRMNRSVIYKVMHIDTSHAELSFGPIFILEIKAALQKVYFNFLS